MTFPSIDVLRECFVYDAARGELTWSLLRAATYSAGFLAVMAALGLVSSWWALLAWPATWLIGFASGQSSPSTSSRFSHCVPAIPLECFGPANL